MRKRGIFERPIFELKHPSGWYCRFYREGSIEASHMHSPNGFDDFGSWVVKNGRVIWNMKWWERPWAWEDAGSEVNAAYDLWLTRTVMEETWTDKVRRFFSK